MAKDHKSQTAGLSINQQCRLLAQVFRNSFLPHREFFKCSVDVHSSSSATTFTPKFLVLLAMFSKNAAQVQRCVSTNSYPRSSADLPLLPARLCKVPLHVSLLCTCFPRPSLLWRPVQQLLSDRLQYSSSVSQIAAPMRRRFGCERSAGHGSRAAASQRSFTAAAGGAVALSIPCTPPACLPQRSPAHATQRRSAHSVARCKR